MPTEGNRRDTDITALPERWPGPHDIPSCRTEDEWRKRRAGKRAFTQYHTRRLERISRSVATVIADE